MTDAPLTPGPTPSPYAAPQPPANPPAPQPYAAAPVAPELPPEQVGRGTLLALLALPVGMILAAVIWEAGFIASLSSFVFAALVVVLYRKGSGGRVHTGIPVLVGLILVGTVLSFFAVVTTDLVMAYRAFGPEEAASYGSLPQFWASNIVYGPVLASYGKDLALLVLFALLGGGGTILRLLRSQKAARA